MYVIRKVNIVKYWHKILQSKDSLMFKLYDMRGDDNAFLNPWSLQVRDLLYDLGLNYLWEIDTVTNIHVKQVTQRIYDQYTQHWHYEINNSPKLETYALFKTTFEFEKYLNCIQNNNHIIALTRLRCSAHKLAIEEGRHRNIERKQRLCMKCNMKAIESEYHFVLVCPLYRDIRQNCFSKYYCSWPSMQKFNNLMLSNQKSIIIKLAKYVYLATLKRESLEGS